MTSTEQLQQAFAAFDLYNSKDPNTETYNGVTYPKEVLYGQRMTARLNAYAPHASTALQLAARCQHIGRWEIARNSYPMDKKGYLQWRNVLKTHHAKLAEQILQSCRYDQDTIDKVKFLLVKKELYTNPDTQILEDVICLVFIEHYLEDFTEKHEPRKVVDILQKTLKKMSPRAIEEAGKIPVSEKIKTLIHQALQSRNSAKS